MFDQDKINNYLENICKNASDMYCAPGITFSFDKKYSEDFNRILTEIRREPSVRNNFPEGYIFEKIRDIISEALKVPDEKRYYLIQTEVNKLKTELKSKISDYKFLFHIEDLFIEKSITIGDVEFFKIDKQTVSDINEIIQGGGTILRNISIYDPLKTGNTYAKVKTRGIQNYAYYSSLTKTRQSINILKFLLYPKNFTFCLDSDFQQPNYKLSYFYRNDLGPGFNASLAGHSRPCHLNNETIDDLEKGDLDVINKLLRKRGKISEFENRILTGIYWFAEALKIDIYYNKDYSDDDREIPIENFEFINRGEKLLKLFMALESVLNFNNKESITQNISERVALLINDNLDGRKQIKNHIRSLYNLRGNMVHQGVTYIYNDDLNYLASYVHATLKKIIILKADIDKTEDLNNYIEDLKFK